MPDDRVYVRPARLDKNDPNSEPRLLRDERTLKPIPAEGAFVRRTRQIERWLIAGDLEIAEPPAENKRTRKESEG